MHPWKLPPGALLDPRWNTALDLAGSLRPPVSLAELGEAWERYGAGQVLAMLRTLAGASGETEAGAA